MELGFLFWLFLVGIVVACFQDIKRREIDNWLNLFLIFSSVAYLLFSNFNFGNWVYGIIFIVCAMVTTFLYFYKGDFFGELGESKKNYYLWFFAISIFFISIIYILIKIFGFMDMPFFITVAITFLLMYVTSNLFYEGRVFAGGDAKLLFAMSVFFVGIDFFSTLLNIGWFIFFLLISGSVYGLVYLKILYFRNFKKVNEKVMKCFKDYWSVYYLIVGGVFILIGLFNLLVMLLGVLVLLYPLLYCFSKSLESVSMFRNLKVGRLREGDWLVNDLKVGRKLIKANWDGLSMKDIEMIKKSGKGRVKIKEGLPFAPAFLLAFLLYVFLKGWVVGLF